MKTAKFIKIFVVLGTAFLMVCSVQGQNWPDWRGVNRDGKVTGFENPGQWPAELTREWQQTVGLGDASPIWVDGKIYVFTKDGNDEVTYCIDAENGKTIWRTVNNAAPVVEGPASSHPGPRSTPAFANGKLYTLGVGGFVHCLDASSGKIIWKNDDYTEVPKFYTGMSPIVVGNKCIAQLGGQEKGTVVAFNAENGAILWKLEGQPTTYASPVTMKMGNDEVLVAQTETDLIGVSMDGKLLWKIPTPAERRFYNCSTPVIDGQNVIVTGQGPGTRSFKIEKSGNEYTFSENWSNPDFGGSFNTPVLKDGFLYGNEARLGKLYCLNAQTGETAWNDETTHNRFAATLNLGNVVLSLPATGNIIIFNGTPEKYNQNALYKVAETEVYAHPIVAGNKIYVKDKEMLTCWSLK